MHSTRYDLRHETDDRLLSGLERLIAESNDTTADMLASLAEIDGRKLYAAQGYSSLFTYVLGLGMSESAASKRIQCCRLARRLPVVFDVVARGDVHLSGLVVLAPHLTEANHVELLAAARHKSRREIEELVAACFPRPDAPARLRRLPGPRMASAKAAAVTTTLPLLAGRGFGAGASTATSHFQTRAPCTLGPVSAPRRPSPGGGSPVREIRTPDSVRGLKSPSLPRHAARFEGPPDPDGPRQLEHGAAIR